MIKTPLNDVQPDQTILSGIYRGIVEDSNDPEKSGRVRVRVFAIHTMNAEQTESEGIPIKHLPWAIPALPITTGGVAGLGNFSVPKKGSHVFVFFENGNIMHPVYFATAMGIPEERRTIDG